MQLTLLITKGKEGGCGKKGVDMVKRKYGEKEGRCGKKGDMERKR